MKNFLKLSLSIFLMTNAFSADISAEVLSRHKLNCPSFETDSGETLSTEVFKIEESGSSLYVLGCEIYAYNSVERVYLENRYGEISDVSVVEVSVNLEFSATAYLMGTNYNPETKVLSTFQKGRGLGDCGSSALYVLKDDKFVLTEASLKEECDGDYTDWPIIYKK